MMFLEIQPLQFFLHRSQDITGQKEKSSSAMLEIRNANLLRNTML